jgi:hypothetical protein
MQELHIFMLVFLETREQEKVMQVGEYQDHIKELSEAQREAFQQLYMQQEKALKVHSVRSLHFFSSF